MVRLVIIRSCLTPGVSPSFAAGTPIQQGERVLDANAIKTLSVPGVLGARCGYLVADNWVPERLAIVVKARPDKLADLIAALRKKTG